MTLFLQLPETSISAYVNKATVLPSPSICWYVKPIGCMASTNFVHLLIMFTHQHPGDCSEGIGNYTLLFNTTDGSHETDINFMDGLEAIVTVDWNVSSAALNVYTSNGFSRSEFYQFSKSEVHG